MPRSSSSDPAAIAAQFAAALDRDDFATVAGLLASHCVYEARSGPVSGPDAVVASYREASAWVHARMDSVRYESRVLAAQGNEVTILFIDHIARHGRQHTYDCQQIITCGPAGIAHIRQVDLPGRREALAAFLAAVGLSRE